jgi:hypothetical protein
MTAIYKCMSNIMSDIGHIGKDQKNSQQGFNFRGIDQTYNALHGIMAKHGVFCTAEILNKTREERTTSRGGVLAFTCLRIRYTFHATDGSSVSTEVEGEGMDSGDKSSNKAMAIGHKYALLQAFLIPTEEQKDPDYEVHEVVAQPDKSVIEKLSLAASYGTKTFREEWKKVKPADRKAVTKDQIAEWKAQSELVDEANATEDPNE